MAGAERAAVQLDPGRPDGGGEEWREALSCELGLNTEGEERGSIMHTILYRSDHIEKLEAIEPIA